MTVPSVQPKGPVESDLSVNGVEVSRSSDLPPIVGRTRVGTEVPVQILRDGKAITLEVRTDELPEEEALKLGSAAPATPKTASDVRLGISISDLTDEQREALEVRDQGVVVTEVDQGPAQRAGVRKGDVILMLNNTKVHNSDEFRTIAGELPVGRAVSVLVQRRGNPIFLALKTEE